MVLGPGGFSIWTDDTRSECGSDGCTLIAHDAVESVDIPILFVAAG